MSALLKLFKQIFKSNEYRLNQAVNATAQRGPSVEIETKQQNSDHPLSSFDKQDNLTLTNKTNIMVSQVILNNGMKMPRIGLGTFGVKEKSLCLKLFSEAITSGYRLFDTGTLVGNEEFIGDVVYDKLSSQELKRDEIFIETKIAPWEHVHWPGVAKTPPADPKNKQLRAETWQELENLVQQGKIRSIGVSNYTQTHLEDLLGYCKLKPVLNQAYSSLGSSQGKPPGWTVLFNNDVVKSIASKHSRTIPQILLRWGLQHDCLLIPKTSKSENLAPNLDIFNFELDEDDMSKLNGLNQDKHFCWNPSQIM